MDAPGPELFDVLKWVTASVIAIAMPFAGMFINRLFMAIADVRRVAEISIAESRENRVEIHRLEVKMSQEFAPKSELQDLRSEVREGFDKTQALIMELMKSGGR